MESALSILTGILFAGSVYMMLGRNLVKFLIGLMLISNAANLVIFTSGRLTFGAPPFVPSGESSPLGDVANALPQALILTAIVIGFGLLAYALVLAYRAYQTLGTVDTEQMRLSESDDAEPADSSGDPL